MSAVEIYEKPFPSDLSALPPVDGYVTFLGVDAAGRQECMDAAVSRLMGRAAGAAALGGMPQRFLLQCFRIDDTETTVPDFAHAMTRIFRAGRAGIGPEVLDSWMAAFVGAPSGGHRTVYGFALFHKPSFTLAEYSMLHADSDGKWLAEAVRKGAPLVRDLVVRIADGGFCWPGPVFDPHGVGIYTGEDGEPSFAVVVDWSSCVMGAAPAERVMAPLLENYKRFLDRVDKGPVERHRDLFYEAIRNLA